MDGDEEHIPVDDDDDEEDVEVEQGNAPKRIEPRTR